MIISDLEHLKVVDPKTNVVGGWIYKAAYVDANVYSSGQIAVAFAETKLFVKTVSIYGSF